MQTHLHLILVGPNDQLPDVYEFENSFGLGNLLGICESACSKYSGMDFEAAKHEYEATYDVMDLFREGQSRS